MEHCVSLFLHGRRFLFNLGIAAGTLFIARDSLRKRMCA